MYDHSNRLPLEIQKLSRVQHVQDTLFFLYESVQGSSARSVMREHDGFYKLQQGHTLLMSIAGENIVDGNAPTATLKVGRTPCQSSI